MSTKKEKAAEAAQFIDRALELPAGTIGGGAIITLHTNREVSVDGCRGVIVCSAETIKLNIGGGTVSFLGKNLMIKSLTDKEAVLAGQIQRVEFG